MADMSALHAGDPGRAAAAAAPPDFRRVFESAPGPILLLDPDLVMVAASQSFLDVVMVRREDLIGRHIFDVFPDNPDDPGTTGERNLYASLDRVRRHLVPDVMPVQRYDVRLPEAQGGGFTRRFWSPVNAPILGEDGRLAYILVRVEDVTDMVRDPEGEEPHDDLLEPDAPAPADLWMRARARDAAAASRQIKEANRELERLARELAEAGRAADRQHQAQIEAEREIQTLKEELLATVSHELRTPLTSVIGYLDLVLEGGYDLEPEVASHLEIARRNGQRLGDLVTDLLLIAQAQAGRLPLDCRPVELASVIEQAVEAARPSANAAGLRIELGLAAVPPVQVDPGRIGQLLDNLISNAVKFTPPGGTVRAALERRPGCLRISVSDTGPGIPEEERPRLFDRFFRTSRAVEDGVSGTGLGLAIAKAIAEAHGGSIGLDERAAAGCTFFVDLPLAAGADDASLRSAEPESAGARRDLTTDSGSALQR